MPLPMPRLFLAFVCFFILSCSGSVPIQEFPVQASFDRDAFYFTKVRPLLDNRCVACHACYTSPCQLNLAEHEGIRRGATKIRLYEGSRLTEIAPTRLGIDAQNYVDWQKKEFFPVAGGGESSLMMALVKQRQINQAPVTQKSKESFLCPKDSGEMVDFLAEHAEKGMPYGLPPLTDAEAAIMSRWLQEGYPALSEEGLAQLALIKPEEAEHIKIWEELGA
ncbi:MAG: hypothetical protein EOP10_27335 [Proteobacteria bacterium]|nr:MAG: hypothetical protein EOP10_27335 [Pseudomonadota bacterium]